MCDPSWEVCDDTDNNGEMANNEDTEMMAGEGPADPAGKYKILWGGIYIFNLWLWNRTHKWYYNDWVDICVENGGTEDACEKT